MATFVLICLSVSDSERVTGGPHSGLRRRAGRGLGSGLSRHKLGSVGHNLLPLDNTAWEPEPGGSHPGLRMGKVNR